MINVISSSRYKINRKQIKLKASKLLLEYNLNPQYTLNIIFVGKTKMRSIGEKYKKKKISYPVLSFSYEGVGEIFICYPQAVLLAAERNKKVDTIIFYLIEHGIQNIKEND